MKTNLNNNDELITRELSEAIGAFTPPAGLKAQIRERIRPGRAEGPIHRLPLRRWFSRTFAAAAAVGLVVASAALLTPNRDSRGAAYAALMEAVENTETAEWVHFRVIEGDAGEGWFSVHPLRQIVKHKQQIEYLDAGSGLMHRYDPAKNTVTVERFDFGDVPAEMKEATSFLGMVMACARALVKEHGAKLIQSRQEIGGKTYNVFTIEHERDEDRSKSALHIRVDADSGLIESMRLAGDQLPQPVMLEFDYPETGPLDIYALGVPRDARVIDARPTNEVLKLHKHIQDARDAFAPQYRAIICTSTFRKGKTVLTGVRVVYKKGRRYRSEDYGRVPGGIGHNVAAEDVNAIESWLVGRPLHRVSFTSAAGSTLLVSPGRDGGLVRKDIQVLGAAAVEYLTWGLRQPANVTRQTPEAYDGLVGLEYSSQGQTYKGKVSSYPWRIRQYYNLSRDYTCERVEQLWDAQAPWQEDKDWLKDVGSESPAASHKVEYTTQVVEYAQTDQGRWYAKRIHREESGDRSSRSEVIVHLDTSLEIPEELFDPDAVTAELFLPR